MTQIDQPYFNQINQLPHSCCQFATILAKNIIKIKTRSLFVCVQNRDKLDGSEHVLTNTFENLIKIKIVIKQL